MRDRIQQAALKQRHYGYRRITQSLRREGFDINHKRVLRILREDNLLCLRKKSFKPATTQSGHRHPAWPNLAKRVAPMTTDQLWVADITYIRLDEAFVYLAVILDAFSRKVVGWALQDHMKTELTLEALTMALETRQVTPGLIHHTDQGVQYACSAYIKKLQSHDIQPSQSRPGCPYDNALAETINGLYKAEVIHRKASWKGIKDVELATLNWVDWFNKQRILEPIGNIPPAEAEAKYYAKALENAKVA